MQIQQSLRQSFGYLLIRFEALVKSATAVEITHVFNQLTVD